MSAAASWGRDVLGYTRLAFTSRADMAGCALCVSIYTEWAGDVKPIVTVSRRRRRRCSNWELTANVKRERERERESPPPVVQRIGHQSGGRCVVRYSALWPSSTDYITKECEMESLSRPAPAVSAVRTL